VAGLPAFQYKTNAKGKVELQISTSARLTAAVPVRTQPFRVAFYTSPGYAEDARYLRAALQAAAVGLPASLEVLPVGKEPIGKTPPDWLFWLSDTPLSAGWRAAVPHGLHVWRLGQTKPHVDSSFLVVNSLSNEVTIRLFQRSVAPEIPNSTNIQMLWQNGTGQPVLTRQKKGRGAVYQLHTRLLPAWSELSDSPALPALLLNLLNPEPLAVGTVLREAPDQRSLDPTQLAMAPGGAPNLVRPKGFRQLEMRPWLVLLAAVLFGIERLLAATRQETTWGPSI
jgi:hypothetical protein